MKYSDWATLPARFAEQIARSRLMEAARRILAATLPEQAAVDAAFAELLESGVEDLSKLAVLAAGNAAAGDRLLVQRAATAQNASIRFDVLMGALARLGSFAIATDPQWGAIGDGAANNAPALQGALDWLESQGGGLLVLPFGVFGVSAQVIVPDNCRIHAMGTRSSSIKALATFPIGTAVLRLGRSTDVDLYDCRAENLAINCNGIAGSVGVFSTQAQEHSGLHNVLVSGFVSKGAHFSGAGCQNFGVYRGEFLPHSSAAAGWVGVHCDTCASNSVIDDVTVNGANTNVLNAGTGVLLNATNFTLRRLHVENMDVGLDLQGDTMADLSGLYGASNPTVAMTTLLKVTNGRGIYRNLVKGGATNIVLDSVNNVTRTDATCEMYGGYDEIIGRRLVIYGQQPIVPSSAMLFVATNASNPAVEAQNSGSRAMQAGESILKVRNINGTDVGALVKLIATGNTTGIDCDAGLAAGFTTPAYGPSVATNAGQGNFHRVTVTNGTAFTIANPTNLQAGQTILYDVLNSSGGAMGVITWDTLFKLAGAFTNPANTKRRTISFYYDGTSLIEVNRAAADI